MLWREALWRVIRVQTFGIFDLRPAGAEIDMADNSSSSDHTIYICTKCRGTDEAARLRALLAADLPDGYAFRAVDCMAGCDNPITVGFQAPGKATYLFGDIESTADIAAISEFARQFQANDSGWTSATERPEALYNKTLARMPTRMDGVGHE